MEPLAHHLAQQARRLGLDSADAHPEAVRAFAQAVLSELAALGLIRGGEEIGCWASPRPNGH